MKGHTPSWTTNANQAARSRNQGTFNRRSILESVTSAECYQRCFSPVELLIVDSLPPTSEALCCTPHCTLALRWSGQTWRHVRASVPGITSRLRESLFPLSGLILIVLTKNLSFVTVNKGWSRLQSFSNHVLASKKLQNNLFPGWLVWCDYNQ